jgi:2-desacetyl-2-hydroxyethyl bacteriochlorophyllide A dehydrogenase
MPEPGPGQVLIKLSGSGVCASDLQVWEGRPWFTYPLSPGRPGHEGWGKVAKAGPGVENFESEDLVATLATTAYAEYTLADADEVVHLPDQLRGTAFPAEPLACAMNAYARCDISAGQSVAIVGAGFQGLLLTQLTRNAGAHPVVLSRRQTALEFASDFGAEKTIILDDHARVIKQGMDFSGGGGYDRVIEATGQQWPLDVAGELTRIRGKLIIVGYHQDPRQVNLQLWNWRGLDVINAHEREPKLYVEGLRHAVAAVISGRLRVHPLITHRFELEDLDEALTAALRRPEGFIKAVVII